MAKTKTASGLFAELFSVALYKRTQGQRVRQITAIAIMVVFAVAAWSLSVSVLGNTANSIQVGIPAAIAAFGFWVAFRIVNYPPAAEFLIGVQSEMDKVSWPAWPQLWRATIVVLVVMTFLATALFLFDVLWRFVFKAVGFLQI